MALWGASRESKATGRNTGILSCLGELFVPSAVVWSLLMKSPWSEIKQAQSIDNSTILNYLLVCKNHALDERVEEKLCHGWYHNPLHEYGILLEEMV